MNTNLDLVGLILTYCTEDDVKSISPEVEAIDLGQFKSIFAALANSIESIDAAVALGEG